MLFPATYDVITPFNNQGIAALRNKRAQNGLLLTKTVRSLYLKAKKDLAFTISKTTT